MMRPTTRIEKPPLAWLLLLGVVALLAHPAHAQTGFPRVPTASFGSSPFPAGFGFTPVQQDPTAPLSPIQIPDVIPARQVTLFGVLATPLTPGARPSADPKLETVEPQLRRLLPNHGFRLLGVQSRRLTLGQQMTCPLGDGFVASTTLLHPFDENGKVQLRCSLTYNQIPQIERLVGTPPNQLFFCEKPLPNGQRLLIGIGAR